MKLKYQMHVREITHQGVKLPQEIHSPKGCWRWLPCGGFIAADVEPPRLLCAPIEVYRWMAFCAPVEVVENKDSEHRYLQVPRVYQRLGLLPKYGENVVIFGAGDWCELWSVEKWVANARTIAGDLENLMAAVKDELAQR